MARVELKLAEPSGFSFVIGAPSGPSHWFLFSKSSVFLLQINARPQNPCLHTFQREGVCTTGCGKQEGNHWGWTSWNSLLSMSMDLRLGWVFLQRYFRHKTHRHAHKSFDSNLFFLLTSLTRMPKEFLLCKVSKIEEGLGKTPYFKTVSNNLMFKVCFDLSWNCVGIIYFCPEYLYQFCSNGAANVELHSGSSLQHSLCLQERWIGNCSFLPSFLPSCYWSDTHTLWFHSVASFLNSISPGTHLHMYCVVKV